MNPLRFARTTHINGRMRSFPRQAWQFWYSTGGIVGEIVRPETSMTLAEIAAACQEAAFDTIADGPHPETDEAYVAWCLLKLSEYGMVAPVLTPTTTETGLSWDALLPTSAALPTC
ncbi:MAG: hypothetical protein KA314_26270 [Chloroflexi bacterium]|nr:hypothetical protein [Chloroflexota bacterium]MBP8059356.1 hypothetical protein [Chloroflexota bacterium]